MISFASPPGTGVQARSVLGAASPLGEFGWQGMPGHLPGCEPETVMPRPGNGCGGSAEPPGKRCQRNWRRSPCPGPIARSSWWQRIPMRRQHGMTTRSSRTLTRRAWWVPTMRPWSPRTPAARSMRTRTRRPPATVPGGASRPGRRSGSSSRPRCWARPRSAAWPAGSPGTCPRECRRSQAKQLGDFINPGQAGLVIVGESKVEDAIKNSVTRAEKQTAQELGVDPKDIDKALQQAVNEM